MTAKNKAKTKWILFNLHAKLVKIKIISPLYEFAQNHDLSKDMTSTNSVYFKMTAKRQNLHKV